ncbi:PepSY-associated TM helix domain-containing protein [Pseudomonas sp. CFBP 8773]|uniref:PepSY-associated TM helix domain-containing protein n=1 Tax=Pseudomonas sp. CFBP 8773 TaxID=2775281 RepID=UPI00237AD7D5|nr:MULTISPECIES: PepSY-associated TM helix domain-containing protein [unclassified Pseudomonas]
MHTWCGLVCGWLLCVIFLTGSLSVFREPITRWMEAQPIALLDAGGPLDQGSAAWQAQRYLIAHGASARLWRVELPTHAGEAIRLLWRDASGTSQVALDPATGNPVVPGALRKTEGGRHFMSFHYMLQLPVLGFWIVGALTVGFLVALVSGVVIHRRIFADFFTFRPGRGPRAWLDAHNAAAVLTLPFQLMIAYTGLCIFASSYMPWPVHAVYGSNDGAHARFSADLALQAPTVRTRAALDAPAPSWERLLEQAHALTGQPAQMLLVDKPGTASASVRVIGRLDPGQPSSDLFTPQASVLFDAASGEVLQLNRPDPDSVSMGARIEGVMRALHFADFGSWALRWVYFASGLLGTLMMVAGTLLFSIKRRIKGQHEFGAATRRFYHCVEALNVACSAGIGLACCAYFYANRLLPLQLPDRANWEIRCFLLIWLATLLHALSRPRHCAWAEQLGLAALLCLCLPLLNHWTTGQNLWRYAAAGDWQRAGVEAVALGYGALLAWVLMKLQRRHRRQGLMP